MARKPKPPAAAPAGTITRDRVVLERAGRASQLVAAPELVAAKLERYLAANPKGPKAAQYRARLKAMNGEEG